MGEEYYQKIFSKNLRKYMSLNNKEQIDLINDLGFNKSAVSTWVNGTRLPRMDKVDALAKYFHVNRSDLIEDEGSSSEPVDIDVRRIERARSKMSDDDKKFMMEMLTRSFSKYFGDDGSDDPD